jgi:hypothetical protein
MSSTKPTSLLVEGRRFDLLPRRAPEQHAVLAVEADDEHDYPPEEVTCVACGRPMKPRKSGAPWHKRCGINGGMEESS